MIRKLRIKFVVTNMSIFTLMLALLLSLVFYFTEAQVGSQNIRMMQELPGTEAADILPNQVSRQIRLPYFIMRLGPDGERISVHGSYYDLSDEKFLDDVLGTASAGQGRTGVVEKYHLRYCFVDGPHSRYLVFSDISSEITTLEHLKKTCMVLGVVGFFAFLGIFTWLSGRVVRPIRESMEQERRFIADASHELKTPLTVLMTNAQVLKTAPEEDIRERCADGILVMSQQMKALVEKMLELARMDAREGQVATARLDFSALLEDAMLPFDPVFYERQLTLASEVQSGIFVQGSREQLSQLAAILLDNAQKYASPGTTTMVRLQRSARHCVLSVANRGCPLSEEELHRIFQRFYRSDQARTRDGSFGLGLAIAQSIAQLHRGRIWAESQNGVNTFFVELPTA